MIMMIMMMNDDSDETHSTPEFSYHYRKTVRLRQTPCTIVFDQFLIVCVSLFYVIDTGSVINVIQSSKSTNPGSC